MRSSVVLALLASMWQVDILSAQEAKSVASSLTFLATFDNGLSADFARGESEIRTRISRKPEKISAGIATELTQLVDDAGRAGGALRFTAREAPHLFYRAAGNVPYERMNWSGTVSCWLKVDPQKELAPGFCDPVQITTRAWNDGAFFVDFDKEGNPRDFRLGAFADLAVWNPERRKISEDQRPLLKVKDPPFSSERWTHVVFTWKDFNNGNDKGVATFYLNGQNRGTITGWNQQFNWKDDEEARLWIGLNYIGLFDELSCFDRCLSDGEIEWLFHSDAQSLLAGNAKRD